jgi:hypothetical protein
LDLFEAQLKGPGDLGLTILTSHDDVETQIQNIFKRLNPKSNLYTRIIETYKKVRQATPIPVPAGLDLAWPSDEKNKYAPSGCAAKGIILYHDATQSNEPDTKDIDINSLQGLPNTQQAAAWVHETVYKFLRETQHAGDSVRARQIVGYLFSDLDDENLNTELEQYGLRPKTGASHLERINVTLNDGSSHSMVVYYESYVSSDRVNSIKYKVSFDQDPSRDPKCKLPYGIENGDIVADGFDSTAAGLSGTSLGFNIDVMSETINDYLKQKFGLSIQSQLLPFQFFDNGNFIADQEFKILRVDMQNTLQFRQNILQFAGDSMGFGFRAKVLHCPFTVTLADDQGNEETIKLDENDSIDKRPFDGLTLYTIELAVVLPAPGTITK